MIRFAARTGLRCQEWLALRVGDVSIPARRLTVNDTVQDGRIQQGQAKTSRSHRTIVLSDAALDALRDHGIPDDPEALVFANPNGGVLNLGNFRNRVWNPALDAAGLTRRGPRHLRHTFATLSLTQEPPIAIQHVSRQLGHADISTTLNHYAAWMPQHEEQLLRLLNEAEGIAPVRAVA
jgi:integrase